MNLRPNGIDVAPLSPARLRGVLAERDRDAFTRGMDRARELLDGRILWNINSTASGGGVAEMLRPFVAYGIGAGIDVRWAVITGDEPFFQLTKRIHNFLHGSPGDGGELAECESQAYDAVIDQNAAGLEEMIRPGDVVILHDPQTAGLAGQLKRAGATVVWRCHVGVEEPNEFTHRAWRFLQPRVAAADALVFTRNHFVPEEINGQKVEIIPPSIDAFSPKNQEMEMRDAHAILSHVGLSMNGVPANATREFIGRDGQQSRVERGCQVLSDARPPDLAAPLVVQVSRWDRLKDPQGVMLGFAEHTHDRLGAQLVLAGPACESVSDDPESAAVLEETKAAWSDLSPKQRKRVHLACIPMDDLDENAAIVNALQRRAGVVIQKSIQEGFGLTVAEAMWKSRPVVASAVGGIRDQIEHGVNGMLLEDPRDLDAMGRTTQRLLTESDLARSLGLRARERVGNRFLQSHQWLAHTALLESVLEAG